MKWMEYKSWFDGPCKIIYEKHFIEWLPGKDVDYSQRYTHVAWAYLNSNKCFLIRVPVMYPWKGWSAIIMR